MWSRSCFREAVGAQDQVSAAYGGFNRINFDTDGSIEVRRMLASQDRLAELEQHLALYFTGFSRFASEIAQEQLKMTPHKKLELDTMLQFVNEAEAIIASPGRPLHEFGRLIGAARQRNQRKRAQAGAAVVLESLPSRGQAETVGDQHLAGDRAQAGAL